MYKEDNFGESIEREWHNGLFPPDLETQWTQPVAWNPTGKRAKFRSARPPKISWIKLVTFSSHLAVKSRSKLVLNTSFLLLTDTAWHTNYIGLWQSWLICFWLNEIFKISQSRSFSQLMVWMRKFFEWKKSWLNCKFSFMHCIFYTNFCFSFFFFAILVLWYY